MRAHAASACSFGRPAYSRNQFYLSAAWEDPGWGRDDASQISILSALHALADQISDTELRTQVKKLSSKGLAKVANRMAGAR